MTDAHYVELQAPQKPSDVFLRINAIAIGEDMMSAAMIATAEMPAERRNNFDHRLAVLLEVMRGFQAKSKIPITALAVDFRLRALVRLLEATYLPGCEIDIATRCPRISRSVLRAACVEPLRSNGVGLAFFDLAGFKSRLLN